MNSIYILNNTWGDFLSVTVVDHPNQICPALRNQIKAARFRTALTGAGISHPSGLPLMGETLRGVRLKEFFHPALLSTNPARYYAAYRQALEDWRLASPNPAHVALARAGVWVITQNIDGLHRDAGSQHVIELHGNLRELRCIACGQIVHSHLALETEVPVCPRCGEMLHPGITLEGEELRHFSRAIDWAGRTQVLLVVGTSLEMEPVRHIPDVAAANGALVIVINRACQTVIPALFAASADADGERR